MGFVKTLLGVVILLAIAVFGYWLYATYTISAADDDMWVKVNSNMPAPLRHWACVEVNGRFENAEAPEGCAGMWDTATAPQIEASEPEAAPSSAVSGTASTESEPPLEDTAENGTISPSTEDSPASLGSTTDTGTPSGN